MKQRLYNVAKHCVVFLILSLLILNTAFAQQFVTKVNGWNAYVHLPDDYSTTSKSYPVIVFVPGIGEVGTNASLLLVNGPSHFVDQGNTMQFVVNGVLEKPIVISIQPPSTWPSAYALDKEIDSILVRWRCDPKRISLTGLSMGAWSWDNYIGSNSNYASRVASMVVMSAPTTSFPLSNYLWFANDGGKWWGFEGTQDYRQMDLIANTINAAIPNAAKYTSYVGGHCCWNTYYDPNWTDKGENIYQWMLRQSQTSVTPPSPTNTVPVANAGSDVSIMLPTNTANLDGSGNDTDGDSLSFQWAKISGPSQFTITSPNQSKTSVSSLVQGAYEFELTVNDGNGGTDKDTLSVTVNTASNTPPTANAGVDQAIQLPIDSVTLSGSANDSDGSVAAYQWTQVSGATATVVSPSAAGTLVKGLTQGTYTFRLTVTDNSGATASDDVTVTVNAAPPAANIPPVVNAGSNIAITLPTNTVNLSGTGSDSDGTISSYQWSKVSGPAQFTITASNQSNTQVDNLVQGTYTFRLTVTDNSGATASDDVTVTVNAAVASGGSCGCTITLSRMSDGGIYANGSAISPGSVVCIPAGLYPYINLSGFNGTASNPIIIKNCGGQVAVTGTSYGISVTKSSHFRLTGTGDVNEFYGFKVDGEPTGNVMSSGLGVSNQSTDFETDHIEIAGTGVGVICKTNPTCDTMTWGGNFVMRNVEMHDMYVHNIYGEGFYVGHTASSVTINCNSQSLQVTTQQIEGLKIYNCKTDTTGWDGIQVASTPVNCFVYNNTVLNYGTRNYPSQQGGILFGGLCNGKAYNNYVNGGTGPGLMILGVGHIMAYNNVIVNCGQDSSAQGQDGIFIDDRPLTGYPALDVNVSNNTVVSPGRSGIRLENTHGTIVAVNEFHNNLVVNPGSTSSTDAYLSVRNGALYNSSGNSYLANTSQAGFYNVASSDYHLTSGSPGVDIGVDVSSWGIVQDKDGNNRIAGTKTDAGAFEYNSGSAPPAANIPPVANAGSNITITLPTNSVNLSGTGSDSDGTISSYQWSKVSGPESSVLVSPSQKNTQVTDLVEGEYKFELKVTDNKGASGTSRVTIIVLPDPRLRSDASIYPNPATSVINVKIDAITHQNKTEIEIYNEVGIQTYREEFLRTDQVVEKQIDVSHFVPGVYFIMVNADINNRITLKFIKQ